MDTLLSIDRQLFFFVNQGLRNPLFDVFFPFLTDLNRTPAVLVAFVLLWLLLLFRGGVRGRIVALILIPTIIVSDQLNSSWLKFLMERPRPCHELLNVHLLVGCGSGFSFPSSHAANSFAAAVVLSFFYPRWTWAFLLFAASVAFSRVYVGVHYPSDVLAGAVVGIIVGGLILFVFQKLEDFWIRRSRSRERRR